MVMVMNIAGRGLIALLFIIAGVAKLLGPKPFVAHMAEKGLPSLLLPLVAVLEVGAGVLILVGWQLHCAALALALFCVATAIVFHLNWSDKAERTLFFKDLAIAGGLIVLISCPT